MNFREAREQGLHAYYYYNKLNHKGGGIGKFVKKATKGVSRTVGNLTGGIIGTSSAEKAQKKAMEEQVRAAEEANRIQREQFEAETKRRAEEQKRAMEEAKRAREEQEKLLREEKARVEAENQYNRQVNQDSGTLHQNTVRDVAKNTAVKTSVDYSGSTVFDKNKDDLDKLKKAFKNKL